MSSPPPPYDSLLGANQGKQQRPEQSPYVVQPPYPGQQPYPEQPLFPGQHQHPGQQYTGQPQYGHPTSGQSMTSQLW